MSPLLNIIAATTANHSVAAVHLEFKAFGEFVDLIEGIGGRPCGGWLLCRQWGCDLGQL